jgi:hypothetical protein
MNAAAKSSPLSEALRQAAEIQKRLWESYERIYAVLGYSEIPPEHVIAAVVKGVEDAELALGGEHERARLFRARKAVEQKRATLVPEADQCPSCGEPLGAPDDDGIRECPECESRFDRSGSEVRG